MARERTGVMLAQPFEASKFAKMPPLVYVQPKLNGLRCRAEINFEHHTCKLYSSTGLTIQSMPHINIELLKQIKDSGFPSLTLDGELYTHGMRFQDLCSLVKRNSPHPEFMQVGYHIFDMISLAKQSERLSTLKALNFNGHLHIVDSFPIGKDNVGYYTSEFISDGYEGAIVRNPNALYTYGKMPCILKIKPREEDYYIIVDSFEAISMDGEPKGMLGGLVLEDARGCRFESGGGNLTHPERAFWWKNRDLLIGKTAHIKYQELSKDQIPLQPILVNII